MRRLVGTAVGKTVAGVIRLRGQSGGEAMPGLVVEQLLPSYLPAMLQQLPEGVVIITGTNGKTTTTKMVVELLKANGRRVLTNATGSNLTRGIISSVTKQATRTGKLPFDIAIFELDEAYAKQFINVVAPRWVLALNVSRDQLDRFGEVDAIARLITDTLAAATTGVVINADDKRLSSFTAAKLSRAHYFGVSPGLLRFFPRDDELVSVDSGSTAILAAANVPLDVELTAFSGSQATYKVDGQDYPVKLQVTGQHNFQNAAAALALVRCLLPHAQMPELLAYLSQVSAAFGRGQVFNLPGGTTVQLALVKNPASFRQGLASYVSRDTAVMIAINDRLADSRDMSWLWDVDFRSLGKQQVSLTTGIRAADMALRLQYDDIAVGAIEPDMQRALAAFCTQPGEKVIFASYTAMLRLYDLLTKRAA